MGRTSNISKPILLNIFTLFFGVLLQTILFQSTALASPVAEDSLSLRELGKRYSGTPSSPTGDEGPAESDYPSDDDIRAAFTPPKGPFVFFSGLPNPTTNQKPYDFSQTIDGAVILRNAFPKSYVNRRYKSNKERSVKWYQNFLDRLSGQYDGTFLDCSIWKRIELPTLTDGGIEIVLVDYSNFKNQKSYPGTQDILPRDEPSGLQERSKGYCFDWPGDGEDANDPDVDPPYGTPYYPGNCGVHLRQYQKNEGDSASNGNKGTSDYRFTILLKDDNQELVGEVDYYDAPDGQGVDVDSELPDVFIATAGSKDNDPVKFAYGSQSWDSDSGQCSVGKYDSGSRQMDCGFTC